MNRISLIPPMELGNSRFLCGNKNNYRFIKNFCKITIKKSISMKCTVTILAIISMKPGKQQSRTPCKSSRFVTCMPKVVSSNVGLICSFCLFLLKLCRITELGIPNNRMCFDFRFHWFLVGYEPHKQSDRSWISCCLQP